MIGYPIGIPMSVATLLFSRVICICALSPRNIIASRLATQHRASLQATPSSAAMANHTRRRPVGENRCPRLLRPRILPTPPRAGRRRVCCPSCGAQVLYQLCGFEGHIASHRHHRFKRDILGIGNNGKRNEKQVALASHGHGHTP